jgi:hypothetical protein
VRPLLLPVSPPLPEVLVLLLVGLMNRDLGTASLPLDREAGITADLPVAAPRAAGTEDLPVPREAGIGDLPVPREMESVDLTVARKAGTGDLPRLSV